MLGGGDQVYNDAVMTQTKLFQQWLNIKNPHHKHEAEFTSEMRDELENFYLERYSMWFSQGLFGMANSQIAMINIWDDHGRYFLHFIRPISLNDAPNWDPSTYFSPQRTLYDEVAALANLWHRYYRWLWFVSTSLHEYTGFLRSWRGRIQILHAVPTSERCG